MDSSGASCPAFVVGTMAGIGRAVEEEMLSDVALSCSLGQSALEEVEAGLLQLRLVLLKVAFARQVEGEVAVALDPEGP